MTVPDSDPRAVAQKLLAHSRRMLSRKLPALTPALYLLEDVPRPEPGPPASDGKHLFYHPETLIALFRRDKYGPARQLLHITCHGLLGHFAKRSGYSNILPVFDHAADRAAQELAALFSPSGATRRTIHPQLMAAEDKEETDEPGDGFPTLEALLANLLPRYRRDRAAMERAAARRREDDHSLWNRNPEGIGLWGGAAIALSLSLEQSPNRRHQNAAALILTMNRAGPFTSENSLDGHLPNGASNNGADEPPACGLASGSLRQEMRPLPGASRVDYAPILRRLLDLGETEQEGPGTFDPIWYHAGLDLTGAPFLEPGEEDEQPRRGDLVVAIDTSGSCQGEPVRQFLQETAALFQTLGRRWQGTVWLTQCDAAIKSVQKLQTPEDWEGLARRFTIRGGGGTDFCPVFDMADDLAAKEENFRGLIYLTDGCGVFPRQAPKYPTVLLLTENAPEDLPPWAERIFLTR